MKKKPSSILLLATALPLPVLAQEGQHGDHDAVSAEIVVTGALNRKITDMLSGTSVLADEELARDTRPTIGETLARQPGVSATSFGPNASRPVLRGFQGERVRVLSDGIGSFDVSNTSVDHAVVINPLTADRIEVLRGPAALLYGSSAIGGVVNVIDSRIPRSVPDEAVHFDGVASFGSAAEERSVGARLDIRLTPHLVAHADGSFLKTGDLRVGGYVLAPALRAAATASGDAEIVPLANLKGKIPNTAARNTEIAGGLAWISDALNMGFSVGRYNSLYGVPVRFAVTTPLPGEELPEDVRLDISQTRYDGRVEISPTGGPFKSITLRGGYADYAHAELEADGSVGTRFFSKGGEGRLELNQRKRGKWTGASGIQWLSRKASVEGAEKFLPPIRSSQIGAFTAQTLDLAAFRLEAGARIERSIATARADADLGNLDLHRRFTAVSGSLGGSFEFAREWRVGLNGSYTQRAPSPEELFPNGPHAGTQAFEIGNPNFDKEVSRGVEMTVHGRSHGIAFSGAIYHNWFSNFIFDQPTGALEDGLPVFAYNQAKARYFGMEADLSARLGAWQGFVLKGDVVADYTRATLVSAGATQAAPRIPALRVLAGLEASSSALDFRAEVERTAGQSRVAPIETTTPGYWLTSASLTWRPWGEAKKVSFLLSANNIFDVVARRHASFLKDYAPLAGRDFRVTLRVGM